MEIVIKMNKSSVGLTDDLPLLRYYADTFDPTLAELVVASMVAKRQMTMVWNWKELTVQ